MISAPAPITDNIADQQEEQILHMQNADPLRLPAAEAVLGHADAVFSELERMDATLAALAGGERGRVQIGSFTTAIVGLVVPAVGLLAGAGPWSRAGRAGPREPGNLPPPRSRGPRPGSDLDGCPDSAPRHRRRPLHPDPADARSARCRAAARSPARARIGRPSLRRSRPSRSWLHPAAGRART